MKFFVITLLAAAATACAGIAHCAAATANSIRTELVSCAAAVRDIPAGEKEFAIPAVCEKASAKRSLAANAEPEIIIDNTWIAADLRAIRNKFKDDCPGCAKNTGTGKAPEKSAKDKNKNKSGGNKRRPPCMNCRDFLAAETRAAALEQLADTIESAAKASSPPPSSASVEKTRRIASLTLSGKEFKWKKEKKKKDREWPWIDKIADWIVKRLPEPEQPESAPTAADGRSASFSNAIAKSAAATALVMLLALIAALIIINRKNISGGDAVISGETPGAKPAAASALLNEAEKLSALGEYRLAIRSAFLAFLRTLEQKGLVVFIANKTNREYLDELKKKQSAGPGIEKLNLLYEIAWYGMKDCKEKDYKEFSRSREDALREI